MSHSLPEAKGGSVASKLTLTKPVAVDLLPFELREHLHRLHLILGDRGRSLRSMHF